jgi:hypothetical protein
MARRPRPDLIEPKKAFARFLRSEILRVQCADGIASTEIVPSEFARRMGFPGQANLVPTWCDVENPTIPNEIERILRALYGTKVRFPEQWDRMLSLYRAARGIPDDLPVNIWTITGERFSAFADIVGLTASQPTPDNSGGVHVAYTLKIHPDKNVRPDPDSDSNAIELGIREAIFEIEADEWQPASDSIFRDNPNHENLGEIARTNSALIKGPHDTKGRIDGHPLGKDLLVKLEPTTDGAAGTITFLVLVGREAFVVTPKDGKGDVNKQQKAVLDAIFASAIPKDERKRLVVARAAAALLRKPEIT